MLVRLSFTLLIGNLGANMAPVTVSALAQLQDVSLDAAGLMGSVEFFAAAIACILVPKFVKAFVDVRLVLTYFAVGALANLLTAAHLNSELTLLARFLSGLSSGCILALVLTFVSQQNKTVRTYSLAAIGATILGAMCVGGLSWLSSQAGSSFVFIVVSFIWMVCGGLSFGAFNIELTNNQKGGEKRHAVTNLTTDLRQLSLLACAGIVGLVQVMLWSQMESLGETLAIPASHLSFALTASLLAGLAGMSTAAFLSDRVNPHKIIQLALLLMLLAAFACLQTSSNGLFYAGIAGWGISFSLMVPFLIGHASHLDSSGKLSAATASVMMIGAAGGPYFGVKVLNDFPHFADVCFSVALVLASISIFYSNRARSII